LSCTSNCCDLFCLHGSICTVTIFLCCRHESEGLKQSLSVRPSICMSRTRAGTGSRVTGSLGHLVSDYVRVGSGLGSKVFTYRPGIVTRLLTEQQNDTAWLTHERIVQSRGSMNTRPLNLKHSKLTLIASQLTSRVAAVYDAAVFERH